MADERARAGERAGRDAHGLPQRRQHRAVGGRPGRAGAAQQMHVLAPGDLLDEARLADAGLAGHQHQGAAAVARGGDRRLQPGLLGLPLDQGTATHWPRLRPPRAFGWGGQPPNRPPDPYGNGTWRVRQSSGWQRRAASVASAGHPHPPLPPPEPPPMPTSLIERETPGASRLTDLEIRGITATSNEAVASLHRPYTWLH